MQAPQRHYLRLLSYGNTGMMLVTCPEGLDASYVFKKALVTCVRHLYSYMSTPCRRRLMRDFKRLQNDPPGGVSGAPCADNIMLWNAVIFGPSTSLLFPNY